MEITATILPGAFIITPIRLTDARGWFCESWNASRFEEAGFALQFVQDNHSCSANAGTLRGLHYQAPPHAQAKLVRCTRGAVIDVIVDVRKGSPTFGQWISEELSADNGRQMLVPVGFLHGFITTEPQSEVQYKVTAPYAPECDGSVRWDSLGIDWQFTGEPILSHKDACAPDFADWDSPFMFESQP